MSLRARSFRGKTELYGRFPYISNDSAGNITHATVATDSGVSTDVRTPNNLNQILTQVVTPAGGGSTTYTRTFNGDGTLATKTDGTNHWVYNWDPDGDQRLLSVVYNGTTQAAYTYDSRGRMFTRTVSGVTTSFEWDGQTCVRETTSGAQTRYYAPWGQLLTFERGGIVYQVLSDTLGSVRVVTDNTGTVVARLDYDPFGNLLATSTDSVPGGMPYRYIGSFGCRWDSGTGLVYMRQRWYDPSGLQRFISRDKLRSANIYAYSRNNPTNLSDPEGLQATPSPPMPQLPVPTPAFRKPISIPAIDGSSVWTATVVLDCICSDPDSKPVPNIQFNLLQGQAAFDYNVRATSDLNLPIVSPPREFNQPQPDLANVSQWLAIIPTCECVSPCGETQPGSPSILNPKFQWLKTGSRVPEVQS